MHPQGVEFQSAYVYKCGENVNRNLDHKWEEMLVRAYWEKASDMAFYISKRPDSEAKEKVLYSLIGSSLPVIFIVRISSPYHWITNK